MAETYVLVTRAKGPHRDHRRPRREQPGWDEHAAFMDRLTASGVVVLGGPLGAGDGEDALVLLDVPDVDAARACLAPDPWEGRVLRTSRAEPWTIWLRHASVRTTRYARCVTPALGVAEICSSS
jgi:uncharacterized protein YciI